jgi:hypothetical protein
MDRRRLQLANSHEVVEENSLFPITLVVGENGQKGIDLYEYYMSQAPENQMTTYIPTAEEKITVEGEEVTMIIIGKGWVNYFQLYTPTFESYPYVLHHDGELSPPED